MDNFMKDYKITGKTIMNIEIKDGNQDTHEEETPRELLNADDTAHNNSDDATHNNADDATQNIVEVLSAAPTQSNSSDEIAALRNEIKEIQESIVRLNDQLESVNKNFIAALTTFTTSFQKLITDEQSLQIDNFGDILSKIGQVESKVSTLQNIVSGISQKDDLNGKIDNIAETIANINYNILSAPSTDANSETVQILNKKLAEYQDDLYMKLLRKYVIDSHISLYTQINDLAHTLEDNNQLNIVLRIIISNLEAIGIKTHTSKSGDPFDSNSMTTGHYPNIETTNETLAGKVAESICPAFIWNLPTIRQQSNQMILKEEEVTLYIIN